MFSDHSGQEATSERGHSVQNMFDVVAVAHATKVEVQIFASIYSDMSVFEYVCTHMRACMYACMHACKYVSAYAG